MLLSKLCLLDRGWSDHARHHGTVCARKPAQRVRHVPLLLCTYISKAGGRGGGNANSRLVVVAYIFIRRRIIRVYMAGFDYAYKHSRSYKLNAV
jgi:hypothetical protein